MKARAFVPLLLCGMFSACAAAQGLPSRWNDAQTSTARVRSYDIDVTLHPATHRIDARVTVSFIPSQAASAVYFVLNPALTVTKITDSSGHSLNAERISSADLSLPASQYVVQVTPATPVVPGQVVQWTFTYTGMLKPVSTTNGGSAEPPQLAAISSHVSYLLYAAHWFPVIGNGTGRFTASIHVHVPSKELALGSGATGTPTRDREGDNVFDFEWSKPGFPGVIIAGNFAGPYKNTANTNLAVYLIRSSGDQSVTGLKLADIAAKQYAQFTSMFGALPFHGVNIVELPAGAVPAYAAPEIAAVAEPYLHGQESERLLANTIARQWWGNLVSPATRADSWITHGMARYAELDYVKRTANTATFANAIFNVSASAVAYDAAPMTRIAQYAPFSPQFQAMTYDKGAMIFRMLQWQIGDADFNRTVRALLTEHSGRAVSAVDVERAAEQASGKDLRPFFTQWLDNAGAPALKGKWTLYRLGGNQGYRIMGEIDEDLDLFQMPVDVRVEMKGKTIDRRISVSGPTSPFLIDTKQVPMSISFDPDRWLLRNSPDLQVRVHVLRGMEFARQGNDNAAIAEYKQALALDRIASLASYRLGEVYFRQRNYQAAESAFRDSLDGDGVPKWTEVWSDVQLGKIFDASGQRSRAAEKYEEAVQTGDNTGGVIGLARKYLQQPYAAPK